jgi:hypothetical protein
VTETVVSADGKAVVRKIIHEIKIAVDILAHTVRNLHDSARLSLGLDRYIMTAMYAVGAFKG